MKPCRECQEIIKRDHEDLSSAWTTLQEILEDVVRCCNRKNSDKENCINYHLPYSCARALQHAEKAHPELYALVLLTQESKP
jgi:hypothetical protein